MDGIKNNFCWSHVRRYYVESIPLDSNGKVERHFRTLKERWLYTLDINKVTSLSQFNGMLKDYMRDYNTTFHRGIDTIPLERYQASKDHPRKPESRQWLDDCFYNRITRKVRKDSAIFRTT